MKPTLIVIGGATASGKSACAVEICRELGGEVVSCDSMQVYRGMNIGTATPDEEEMGGIPHHLLNALEPEERLSAAAYREMALPVIEGIRARGKTPVLCGGTGLYVNALTRPLGFAIKGNDALRAELEGVAAQPGGKRALHAQLEQVDPACAARLHENDVRRVIRALEVFRLTGKTLTEQSALDKGREGDYRALLFALSWPREELYARIDRRVDDMMKRGLLGEVKALLDKGIPRHATAMQAIGYKELAQALEGRMSLEEAIESIKQGTRRYAKRQQTWFRGDERARWIDAQGRALEDISREIIGIIRGERA